MMYVRIVFYSSNKYGLLSYFFADGDFVSHMKYGTLSRTQDEACVNFTVVSDDVMEGDEMFTISLSVGNIHVELSNKEVDITIEDDSSGNAHWCL